MKKERSINELLKLMLDNQDRFANGLCRWIDYMSWDNYITGDEFRKLIVYIKENRPKNIYWLTQDEYYWKRGDIHPRIKWIKKHIKRTEK